MQPSITEKRPGKKRITCNGIEIYADDVLNLPIGMMFFANDKLTETPRLCVMTYGGVLIEEFEPTMTPELLNQMIKKQEEHASTMADLILSNEAAMEAAKLLQAQTRTEDPRDVG
jgi:hypothetical protein